MSGPARREAEFRRIIEADPDIAAMLAAMRTFDAPDLWLVSGLLFQTVWNVLEGCPRGHGILDYDLFYFDPDTSEDAEDRWIKRAAAHFAFAPREVQLRNQARVHLWYPKKFAIPYPQLHSSCDGHPAIPHAGLHGRGEREPRDIRAARPRRHVRPRRPPESALARPAARPLSGKGAPLHARLALRVLRGRGWHHAERYARKGKTSLDLRVPQI